MPPLKEMRSRQQLLQLLWQQSGPKVLAAALFVVAVAHQLTVGWGWGDVVIVFSFVLLRSIVEWCIHAYIMHAAPLPLVGWRLKNPIYHMHIYHHKHSDDLDGLFFKGRGVFVLLFISYLVLLPFSLHVANLFVFCFALGLLFYEVFHMLSHSDVQLASKKIMSVVMNHRHHHEHSARNYFGVSSLLADKLFKTIAKPSKGFGSEDRLRHK